MKFTPSEAEILLHRLEGGTIPEVMVDSDIMDEEEAIRTVEGAIALLKNGLDITEDDDSLMAVIIDAADGSTYFAGLDEAVANGQCSKGKAMLYHKAANSIEKKLNCEVPRG